MASISENGPVGYAEPVESSSWRFPLTAVNGSVSDLFEEVARRFPSRLAIQDDVCALTYAELGALIDEIASATAAVAAARPGPVAILLRNDARFPAAMLGVLAAGRGYVPLDAEHPIERNRLIAAHASAAAIISAGPLAADANRLFPNQLQVLDLDLLDSAARVTPVARAGPDDLAWIVYTSGSTGSPKGVYQSHRGLLHDILEATSTMLLTCEDRLAQFASPSVITGIRTTFAALLNGSSLHILPPRALTPSGLVREIHARRISVFRSAPVLFRRVVEALGPDERLESLRLVSLAGDRVDWNDVDQFRRACRPEASLEVHVGSTECSTAYLEWFVDETVRRPGAPLPIGRPLPDKAIELVDSCGVPVEGGETGEIAVRSRYVALGYWRDPELTAGTFAADPADPLSRTFRTGDLARRRPDGLFEFFGRADEQVKLHGHRIELGEIESALRGCGPVRDAAVLVRRDERGAPRALIAYVELRHGIGGLLPRHLMAILGHRLPPHMAPGQIRIIDELPRLHSLKIDWSRLSDIDAARSVAETSEGGGLIDEVAGIFELVLGREGATPEDNVASLGGDSLQAVNVALELERHFGIPVPPERFAAAQTIRDLSRWIAMQGARSEDQTSVAGARTSGRAGLAE